MKKIIRNISLAALMLMVIISFSAVAFAADGTVTYQGKGNFVFGPGSNLSETQLFPELEGAMPGDTIEQKVTVKNDSSSSDYIKVYLKAEAHDEESNPLETEVKETETVATMSDFLSKLEMTVKNGSEIIFEGSPDVEDGLSSPVLLGKLKKGESLDLVVTLKVPADLGNEYADRKGEVDWIFTVDELNENASLKLTKEITSKPADGKAYTEGETIEYLITAENDGNVLLTNVVVEDELTGDKWTIEELKPGDKKTFTATYTVTAEDAANGSVENVVAAEAEPDNPDIGKVVPDKPSVTADTAETPEEPVEPDNPDKPTKTGDTTRIVPYVAAFGAAIIALLLVLFRKKKDVK